MAILHSFLEHLRGLKVIRELPDFPKIQVQRPAIKWAESDVQAIVMEHITPESNQLIFRCMFETGMRPQEARALYPEDFSYKRKTITVQRAYSRETLRSITKTKQVRIVPIKDALAEAINEMLKNRPATIHKQHLFVHEENTHYTQGRLYKIWARACKSAGVEGVSMYGGTRHSFASNYVNDNPNANMKLLQAFMGHSDMSTTNQYTHTSADGLRKVININRPKTVLNGSSE